MANDSYTQQALAADPNFQTRVRACLGTVAWQVLEEDPSTANHQQRASYANTVTKNLAITAQQVAPWLVMRPNLFEFDTSYNFQAGAVISAAGDPDIQSQLLSDWDEMAGVGLTSTPAAPVPPPSVRK